MLDDTYLVTSMRERFVKLSTDFAFNFDVDKIISEFDGDRVDPTATSETNHKIYRDPSGVPHWQYFSGSNIRFARNFVGNYYRQCVSIAKQLTDIQNQIKKNGNISNSLIEYFLSHTINADNVGLIKQQSGVIVKPHIDYSRTISLNIGLKNSNTATTYVSGTSDVKNFESLDLESYTMNDGDVYLLRTQFSHSVKSLMTAEDNLDRYIVTYSLVAP